MKILMTCDTVGGVWTYALELASALEPHGVEVALATMGAALSSEQWEQARHIPNLQVFQSAYKLEWMDDPWDDITRAGQWMLELENRLRPDVIHLNSGIFGALPWQASVLSVTHSCVLSWWEAVKGMPAPPAWNRYREEMTRGLRASDLVIVPSRAMLASVQKHYGPLPTAQVIYNGRDPSRYIPAAREKFIFSAGRLWDEAKNIAALEAVAEDLPWPVRVAGEANPNSPQKRRIEILGRLSADAMTALLAKCPIYALPARYEPFGLSILEAAMSGCALVIGDLPSLREIWDGAALFVQPEDPDELRSNLLTLIDRWPLRQWLGARARNRAQQYHSRRMAASYLVAYRRLGADRRSLQHSMSDSALGADWDYWYALHE